MSNIVGRKEALTRDQKEFCYYMHAAGLSHGKLAYTLRCSVTTVRRAVYELEEELGHCTEPMKYKQEWRKLFYA